MFHTGSWLVMHGSCIIMVAPTNSVVDVVYFPVAMLISHVWGEQNVSSYFEDNSYSTGCPEEEILWGIST